MNLFNRILLGTVITFGSIYSAQHLKVEYENIELQDPPTSFGVSKEFQEKLKAERKKPQKFFLYYANGESLYKSVPRKSFVNNAGDLRVDEKTISHNREVYKDIELKVYKPKGAKGVYVYQNFLDIREEFYGYKDTKFSSIDYKDETITIDKYHCKLVEVSFPNNPSAKTKVWYTEDIPISAGPNAFNIFPGLVLRVESPQYINTAVKISNEAKLSDLEKINPKLPVYKEEEFYKKMKEIRERRSKVTKEEIRL